MGNLHRNYIFKPEKCDKKENETTYFHPEDNVYNKSKI